MIKRILSLAAVALLCSTSAFAQARNISLTYAPIGMKNVFFKYDDTKEKYKYSYEYTAAASFEYEKNWGGNGTFTKVSVGKFKARSSELDFGDLGGDYYYENGKPDFNVNNFNDGLDISIMEYFSRTINPNKRFQLPIYFGAGLSYLQGAPVHNLTFDLGLMVRAKFYFTNNFGMFVGGSGTYGIGMRTYEAFSSKSTSKDYMLTNRKLQAEAGLLFSF